MRRHRPLYRIDEGCANPRSNRAVCPVCGCASGVWEFMLLNYDYPGFQHPCNPIKEEPEWLEEPDWELGF